MKFFLDEYGITEEEVIKLCGKQTVNQIKADEIALMLGIYQSLKDGDTTIEEVLEPIRKEKKKDDIAAAATAAATKGGSKKKDDLFSGTEDKS